jgi:hypothetical protein
MPFRAHSSLFDNDDLAIMRSVYDEICMELGITARADDANRRGLVALAIVLAAENGERDPAVLRARALAKIKRAVELRGNP